MSTYYFLVCEDHKERCDAASKLASNGVCQLCDSDVTLLPFIVQHSGCNVRIASEHEDDIYEYLEWTKGNVDDLYARDYKEMHNRKVIPQQP